MKKTLSIIILSVIASSSYAITVSNEVLKGNVDLCVMIGSQVSKYAPKEKDKLPKFCTCVWTEYFKKIPQSEIDAAFADARAGKVLSDNQTKTGRLQEKRVTEAEKMCSKN